MSGQLRCGLLCRERARICHNSDLDTTAVSTHAALVSTSVTSSCPATATAALRSPAEHSTARESVSAHHYEPVMVSNECFARLSYDLRQAVRDTCRVDKAFWATMRRRATSKSAMCQMTS